MENKWPGDKESREVAMSERGVANREATQESGRGMETPKEGISSHLLVQVKMSLELANPEVPSHTEPGVMVCGHSRLCRCISITGVQLHLSPTPNTPKDTHRKSGQAEGPLVLVLAVFTLTLTAP